MRPKNHSGYSLIELVMSVGLFGIIATLSTQTLNRTMSTRARMESVSTRDSLYMRIGKTVNKKTLRESANLFSTAPYNSPGTQMLKNCIDDDTSTICTASALNATTNTNEPVLRDFIFGYQLSSGVGALLAGIDTGSSNPALGNPVLYTRTGQLCKTTSCKAEWKAIARFVAICPSGASSCGEAEAIRVRFQLSNTMSSLNNLLKRADIPSLPASDIFNSISGGSDITIRVMDTPRIGGTTVDTQCPANSMLIGIKGSGIAVCRCLPGSTSTGVDIDGNPICSAPTDNECADPWRYELKGFDSDMKPICRARSVSCTTTADSDSLLCTGYLSSYNAGTCTARAYSCGKRGKSTCYSVSCSGSAVRCCRILAN